MQWVPLEERFMTDQATLAPDVFEARLVDPAYWAYPRGLPRPATRAEHERARAQVRVLLKTAQQKERELAPLSAFLVSALMALSTIFVMTHVLAYWGESVLSVLLLSLGAVGVSVGLTQKWFHRRKRYWKEKLLPDARVLDWAAWGYFQFHLPSSQEEKLSETLERLNQALRPAPPLSEKDEKTFHNCPECMAHLQQIHSSDVPLLNNDVYHLRDIASTVNRIRSLKKN